MWTKPYGMKEGFLIGGGLIIAGLMLQLSVGPVDWDAFRWPVNGIVLAGFIMLIAIFFLLRKKVHGLQFIGTYKAAIPTLVYAVVLTIIMGLTRQDVNGTWLNNMLSFWPFVLIYVYMAVILGQIILRRTLHFTCWRRDIPFLLNHLGLFLAMTTATLGNADMQRLKMMTVKGEPEWCALTSQQQIIEMPILHSDTLVPALQSPWFRPHIIVYMLAYTLMASAAVIALYLLLRSKLGSLDNLVIVGISLITIGMLFGALWAKEAWGHYWSWDPKETWAAITWFAYLIYIHYRQIPTHKPKLALWVLLISFVLLQMCWWGINYLPSAQGSSVHVYNMP